MSVNFFDYAKSVSPAKKFGIVDPDDTNGKFPAKLVYDDSEKWNATVICNNRDDYLFVPIDNNADISVTRTNDEGEEESDNRCDAMLGTKQTVCFVELKNERENWLPHAVKQLESTIAEFGENIEKFKSKKAYACNLRHPNSSPLYSNTQTQFYRVHKIVLRTKAEIEELK